MKKMLLIAACMLTGCAPAMIPFSRYEHGLALIDQGADELRAGELEKAEASFRMAVQLASLAQGMDGLGCVAMLRGDFPRAERLFRAAYEMDAAYDTPLANLALLYDITGRKEEARRIYSHAVEVLPDDFRLRSNFGAFLADSLSGERTRGAEELENARALAQHPLIEVNLTRLQNGEVQEGSKAKRSGPRPVRGPSGY